MHFPRTAKLQKRLSVQSSIEPTAGPSNEMCKPRPIEIENWRRPKPREVELLVPADSEAGRNLLDPKVRYMLGIRSVTIFEMLPSGVSVLLAM